MTQHYYSTPYHSRVGSGVLHLLFMLLPSPSPERLDGRCFRRLIKVTFMEVLYRRMASRRAILYHNALLPSMRRAGEYKCRSYQQGPLADSS
jgi:hypothetical protein